MGAWTEIENALSAARAADYAIRQHATSMAALLKGRLRDVNSHSTLKALKRELREYNIRTGRWSEES